MRAGEARRIAADWVRRYAEGRAGFRGALFSGSILDLADDAELAPTSDVDVLVVINAEALPEKLGKILLDGVIVEVTYVAWVTLRDVDLVARTFYLAPSFRRDMIISDPTGRLRHIQRSVAATFGDPAASRLRCASVMQRLNAGQLGLQQARRAQPPPALCDLLLSWLFPASLPAVVVLVAAGRNPTVRLRYLRARSVLAEHGLAGAYEDLLGLIGCAAVSAQAARDHLGGLSDAFDAAAGTVGANVAYASDISPQARPIAITGTVELIDAGFPREAVFWLMVTFARSLHILHRAQPSAAEHDRALRAAATELLGVSDRADVFAAAARLESSLPMIRDMADAIIDDRRDSVGA